MRRYKFTVGSYFSFELGMDWFTALRKGNLAPIHRLIGLLGTALIVGFIAAVPLLIAALVPTFMSDILRGVELANRVESELLYYLMVVVSALVTLLLCWMVLTRWQHLADPPMFLSILVFALMVIGAYLLSVDPSPLRFAQDSQRNTFGVDGTKALAGITVMTLIGFFYTAVSFINIRFKSRLVVQALSLAALLTPIVMFVWPDTVAHFSNWAVLLFPAALLYSVWVDARLRTLLAILVTVALGVLIFRYPAWQNIFITIATLLVWMWLWMWSRNWAISNPIKTLTADVPALVKRQTSVAAALQNNLIVVVPLVILAVAILGVVWVVQTKTVNIAADLQAWGQQVTRVTNTFGNFKEVLVGNGARVNLQYSSSFHYILHFQGVVGVLAYALLAVVSILAVGKRMFHELKDANSYKVATVLMPVVIMFPLLAMLRVVRVIDVMLWWFVITAIITNLFIPAWKHQFKLMHELKIRGRDFSRVVPFIQLLVIILIIVAWALVANAMWQLLGDRVI